MCRVLDVNRHRLNPLARKRPAQQDSPLCHPKPIYISPACYTHTDVKRPREGTSLLILTNSGGRHKIPAARIDTVSCHKCGSLHTNLSRHSRMRGRTHPKAIPRHPHGLDGEPFVRYSATPSASCSAMFQPKRAVFTRAGYCRGEKKT